VADDGATGTIPPERFEIFKQAWSQRGTSKNTKVRAAGAARAGDANAPDRQAKAGRSRKVDPKGRTTRLP